MRKVTTVLFLFIFSANLSFAQEIVTDRPDQTESAVIVPQKHIQIESGLAYNRESFTLLSLFGIETDAHTYTVPTVLFRYGVESFLELRLNAEYQTTKFEGKTNNVVTSSSTQSGLLPVQIGAKLKLFETKSKVTKGALLVSGDIPALSSGDYTDGSSMLEARFAFQTEHKDGLAIGLNVGMEYVPSNGEKGYLYTIAPSFGLSDRLGAFIELYGFYYPTPDAFYNYLDGGFTYSLAPNTQLDLSAGIAFSVNTNYFISTGFSIRLPK